MSEVTSWWQRLNHANVESWYFRHSASFAVALTVLAVILGIALEPAVGWIVGFVAMRFWVNALYRVQRRRR